MTNNISNELYDDAIKANANGTLTAWLVDYLKGSGRNEILAGGLAEDGQYSTGLIDYPLGEYAILMGPDKSLRYYEDPEKFNSRVDAMVESLRNGWKPVPLIASDLWNNGLELNDGTHRMEALRRFGATTYPTVFYFKSDDARRDFLAQLNL